MPAPFDRNSGERAGPVSATNPSRHDNFRLALVYEPIDRIETNPRDPRVYEQVERQRIVRALCQFGPLPLIVNEGRTVLSGNVWLEAARIAGFTELPIIVAEHLTPVEADAFMLAQVRLVERGKWD